MRVYVKEQIIELIPTVCEGLKYAKNADMNEADIIYADCLMGLNTIKKSLETGLTNKKYDICYKKNVENVIGLIEQLKINNELTDRCIEDLTKILLLLNNEEEVKFEILFLPYKSSMWDSLESIYLAAKEDKRCDAYVVPIPYFERNPDRTFGKMCYEGESFPSNIPVIPFNNYDIAKRKPDIIYTHNPYDEYNYVTSVHPLYYSSELKKHTNMLVYVPYFIPSVHCNNISEVVPYHVVPGGLNANKVIASSDITKEILIASGYKKENVLALGTPKIDAVLNFMKNPYNINQKWIDKINGRKVILLNSSITNLLKFVTRFKESYMEVMEIYIKKIIGTDGLFLIWRPHPLLESTINSMRPNLLSKYKELKKIVLESENAIFDETESAFPAMYLSDGLISDFSSILRQYIFTGKPIFSIVMNGKISSKYKTCDIFSCYFRNDGVKVGDFCNMILTGEDLKHDERLNRVKASIANSNGICGEKIHQTILEEIIARKSS